MGTTVHSLRPASYDSCVHCGLCLPKCPTYEATADENDSPRGRITLMQAVDQGRLGASPAIRRHLDSCLDCRACETACPSGVPYGQLIEAFRIRRPAPADTLGQALARAALWILPYPRRLRWLHRAVQLAEATGLFNFVSDSGLLPAYAAHCQLARVWPAPPARPITPHAAPPHAKPRCRTALFTGCISEALFGATNRASHRVLLHNGCAVDCPPRQGCCGALHYHAGDLRRARDFARANIDAFDAQAPQADAIVVNVAGCGLMLKDYGTLLQDDPGYAAPAARFAERVRDIHEFLAALPMIPPRRTLRLRLTYHDACHLSHGQHIRTPPRDLLQAISGIELLPLFESDWCCGAAGAYTLTQPQMAGRLADRKLQRVAESGAQVVAAANAGCILHLQLHALSSGRNLQVLHPIDLLDVAYGGTGGWAPAPARATISTPHEKGGPDA